VPTWKAWARTLTAEKKEITNKAMVKSADFFMYTGFVYVVCLIADARQRQHNGSVAGFRA